MSEKYLFFSVLYDFYGNLLKENQATVIDLYYNQDFSLAEIAEELNMSRAGVHDTLKRAEKNLTEYEDKLALHSKYERINEAAERIIDIVGKISLKEYKEITDIKIELVDIKDEAEKILNEG